MDTNILDASHERAVRRAMSDATDDLLRRRKERQHDKKEVAASRLKRIEKQSELLEPKR